MVQLGVGRPGSGKPREPLAGWVEDGAALAGEIEQLEAYFRGSLQVFEMALAPRGTAFQLEVWAALQAIPYGETVSYREIARTIGRPAAVRAVGAANGANPIGIVIPCHRVIGADGSLTGYGGGIENKARLLAHERRNAGRAGPAQFGLDL
jgi:methylated-DNA-[protein]-cysteine S-methyltransferase